MSSWGGGKAVGDAPGLDGIEVGKHTYPSCPRRMGGWATDLQVCRKPQGKRHDCKLADLGEA